MSSALTSFGDRLETVHRKTFGCEPKWEMWIRHNLRQIHDPSEGVHRTWFRDGCALFHYHEYMDTLFVRSKRKPVVNLSLSTSVVNQFLKGI